MLKKRAGTLFAILITAVFSCTPVPKESSVNVVIINIDDMGWRDLGFMGSQYYHTPNLDRLAQSGMTFLHGYACASNCAPSRASLMTGRWTARHGIYTVGRSERGLAKDRKLIPTKNTTTLSTDIPVIPGILQNNGYTTCHSGKWHLGEDPMNYGFGINIGGGHNGHPGSYYPPYKNVAVESGESQHLTDRIMENTLAFLDTAHQPFFLNYAPYAVHTPIQAIDSLLVNYVEKPAWNGQQNAAYATMIENLDRNIGMLMNKLGQLGILTNTFIMLTSDNGGLYGITRQHPLRTGKGSYYEGGIRVPLVFVWKNKIEAGSVSNTPVSHLDFFPTIMDVVGISKDSIDLDGRSILPHLTSGSPLPPQPLYWHFPVYLQAYDPENNENRDPLFRTRPGSVVRDGSWKLHYYFEDGGIELYNLETDAGERINLVKEYPEQTREMMDALETWWAATDAPVPTLINPEYEE